MKTYCIIFRNTANGWCACRFNVPEATVHTEYDTMKQQDPNIKLKILRVKEEVIVEDT